MICPRQMVVIINYLLKAINNVNGVVLVTPLPTVQVSNPRVRTSNKIIFRSQNTPTTNTNFALVIYHSFFLDILYYFSLLKVSLLLLVTTLCIVEIWILVLVIGVLKSWFSFYSRYVVDFLIKFLCIDWCIQKYKMSLLKQQPRVMIQYKIMWFECIKRASSEGRGFIRIYEQFVR